MIAPKISRGHHEGRVSRTQVSGFARAAITMTVSRGPGVLPRSPAYRAADPPARAPASRACQAAWFARPGVQPMKLLRHRGIPESKSYVCVVELNRKGRGERNGQEKNSDEANRSGPPRYRSCGRR